MNTFLQRYNSITLGLVLLSKPYSIQEKLKELCQIIKVDLRLYALIITCHHYHLFQGEGELLQLPKNCYNKLLVNVHEDAFWTRLLQFESS